MTANTYAAKLMKSSSSSPTTFYSESFLDSSNNTIPKICVFGKKCRSLKKGQAPCLSDIHVDEPEKMIEEIKQKFTQSQIDKKTDLGIFDNQSNFHIPSFTSDISSESKMFTKIPSVRYIKTINEIEASIITFEKAINDMESSLIALKIFNEIDDKVDSPKKSMSDFINSVVSKAMNSESPTIDKAPDMNVVFGNSQTNFVMKSTKGNISSKLAKLNSDDDSKSPWIDVLNRKDTKKARQDGASSPLATVLMKSERSSPVNFVMMKSERDSPVPSALKKIERSSPVPEVKTSSKNIMECNFKTKCNKSGCLYKHPNGYIPGSVGMNMCHNSTKCFNQYCKFIHPDGYVPMPNVRCLGGDDCHKEKMKKGSCPFSHPDDKYWDKIPENTRKYNKKF